MLWKPMDLPHEPGKPRQRLTWLKDLEMAKVPCMQNFSVGVRGWFARDQITLYTSQFTTAYPITPQSRSMPWYSAV
jgi:hypothetical protein